MGRRATPQAAATESLPPGGAPSGADGRGPALGDASGEREHGPRPRRSRHDAVVGSLPWAALASTVLLLWVVPAWGTAALLVVVPLLAPWGRTLGDRVAATLVVALGVVALVLTLLSATGAGLGPVGWRLLATLAVLAVGAGVARRGPRRAWPTVEVQDVVAGATGIVFFVGLAHGLWRLSTAQLLSVISGWWDLTNHLTIFTSLVHAQSWDLSRIAPDPFFGAYPSLHAGSWAVITWLSGVGPDAPGATLVRGYVDLSFATAAVSVAVLTSSAATVARTVARSSTRRGAAAAAALVTGAWALLGSAPVMALFGWSNFLLGTAVLTVGSVAASRSSARRDDTAWFVVPLSALVLVYLYTPLVLGLVPAGVVVLVRLIGRRDRQAVGFLALCGVTLVASLPSLGLMTRSNPAQGLGAVSGVVPAVSATAALVVAGAALLLLVRRRPTLSWSVVAALSGPLLALLALAAAFQAQAVAGHVTFDRSYYTQKALLGLTCVSVPLLVGVASGQVLSRSRAGALTGRARVASATAALLVACLATSRLGATFTGDAWGPGHEAFATESAVIAASQDGWVGRWSLALAREGRPPRTVVLAWRALPTARDATSLLKVDHLGAGLAGAFTVTDDRAFNAVSVPETAALAAFRGLLDDEPALRLVVVVPDETSRDALDPLLGQYGFDRLHVVMVG